MVLSDELARYWMDRAIELAKTAAARGEVPVGAVVLKPGENEGDWVLVGEGFNTREQSQDPTGHAELVAIRNASERLRSWRLSDCVLVVTLEPCPMCLGGCQQARVGQVIYAAMDPKGGAWSLGYRFHEDPRTNHRFNLTRVDVPEAGEILTQFFQNRRAADVS